MNVSKLTKVKIKDIWKTEDRDFTPWLVENIARLNEDLGFNIQDPQKESRLENFIVDIVGKLLLLWISQSKAARLGICKCSLIASQLIG